MYAVLLSRCIFHSLLFNHKMYFVHFQVNDLKMTSLLTVDVKNVL